MVKIGKKDNSIKIKSGNFIKNVKQHWQLLGFMIIPIIYLIIFKYIPMVGVQIAFKKFSFNGGIWGSDWVGFDQFIRFFNSYQFERVIVNTLVLAIYTLIAGFPIPIMLALFLNSMRNAFYRKTIQTVIYIPHFISVVVLVGMLLQLVNPRIGIYGTLSFLINGEYPRDLLASPQFFPHLYVWSDVWQKMGWNTIIYTAALSSVSMELHEAAQIDGASRFKRMIHIDFPVILPTAVIMLILSSGRVMNIGFEKVYLMQNQLNLRASEVITTYVYKVGLGQGRSDFSYATAIGLFNSVINMLMLLIVNAFARKFSESSLW